jgi:serine/threonine protein kinase/Tfp pilus assembly protein PilF
VSPAPGTTSILRPDRAALVDRLAEEMTAAWRRGERPSAESFFANHPELLSHPADAVRLVYEEVCLRQECGQEVTADELARRFPDWADELALVLDCHRLMESRLAPPSFPEAGDRLGEFRLVAELGRGAHGRVFLATQSALADRPVVLKVTPLQAREHLSLARLQHTHVIPLHAVYDFPARRVRAICMPFLGGATLARVLELLQDLPLAERTGQALLDALNAAQRTLPIRLSSQGAYRRALARATYVEAVCGIGACLADGLHYAHERGLVHLDIKPSNVLLAADAQPLLLDFHVSLHPVAVGAMLPEGFGGTGPFMSPEQARAWDAAEHGAAVPQAVDARSDLYSLGRLLYVALSGQEVAADGPLPPLHRINPQVSVGLSDVIQKCLDLDPAARYADAAALAGDLRRHLAHLPLQGVANRSLRERWQKWRRRWPNAALWACLLFALAATGCVLTGVFLEHYQAVSGTPAPARAADLPPQPFWVAFTRGIHAYRSGQYAEAVRAFDEAAALEPASAETYYNRGRAHAACGQVAAARRDYDLALERDPKLGVAWLNRGVLHYQGHHYSQAAADLGQALRHGADPVAVHFNLALVAIAGGDKAEARRHLNQVLSRNPGHADARALLDELRASR